MPPERKRRAQSFFGLHFDFHADDRAGIGAGLTEAAIDAVLARVRPDYVQCDCKGHWGLASYPTRVGTPAPGLAGDPLRTWRDATARRGVALYVHYSGLFDKIACSRGSGWARTRPDGTLDTENAPSATIASCVGRRSQDFRFCANSPGSDVHALGDRRAGSAMVIDQHQRHLGRLTRTC